MLPLFGLLGRAKIGIFAGFSPRSIGALEGIYLKMIAQECFPR